MDTTEQYIKMCDKAEEIQQANLKHIQRQGALPVNIPFYDYDGECYLATDNLAIIWLPRQDQLQEILRWAEDGRFGVLLIDAFYNFAKNNFNLNPTITWEQLWLAFVMKEKYNKIWDGENWVKDNG